MLGCVLLDAPRAIPAILEGIPIDDAVFYDVRHLVIWQTCLILYDQHRPIDLVTVTNHLRERGKIEASGGSAYLAELPDLGIACNLDEYCEIVTGKYLLRKLIQLCQQTSNDAVRCNGSVVELLDRAESNLLRLATQQLRGGFLPAKAILVDAIEELEALHRAHGQLTGLETGFPDMDKLTNGLQRSELVILAARPSVGKTSLALNMADHISVDLGLPVGFFSLEMRSRQLLLRMISSRSRVDLRTVQSGEAGDKEMSRMTAAAAKINKAPFYVDDEANLTILQLRAKSRRLKDERGVKCLFVDYLQMVSSPDKRRESRFTEISDVSCGLKTLAKELDVPIVALAQLSREVEKGEGRTPKLSDLRESGNIEQDADVVCLMSPVPKEKGKTGPDKIRIELAKHRNGPVGSLKLVFSRQFTRFDSASRVDDEDVPEEKRQPTLPYYDDD